MLEELQELGDHNVQRPVQHVAVQDLGRVLADLLQGPERSLRGETETENQTETVNGLLSFCLYIVTTPACVASLCCR